MENIKKQLQLITDELLQSGHLKARELFVIGCSTSEIAGERIGSAGSEEIAAVVYEAMQRLEKEAGVKLAFQCCEHLNRALVVERETSLDLRVTEVFAKPVPRAGGSMAAYAYSHLTDPVLAEAIQAQAGIDIGETMIGMHLQAVAVPLRLQERYIGAARTNAAFTRPKLIGGHRAVYPD